jgi:general secretion pathway protein A
MRRLVPRLEETARTKRRAVWAEFIEAPRLLRADLLRLLAERGIELYLAVTPRDFAEITRHVRELSTERVHPVFLLDEAHLLQQQVLDHLHILSNYEWDSAALLSLVLVGLPELDNQLRLSRNRSLWSRIHTRVHLGDAAPDDTAEYIHHRLVGAGRAKGNDLFDSDSITILHEATEGHLRDIDRVATDALKRAARRKLKRIDRRLIQHIMNERDLD